MLNDLTPALVIALLKALLVGFAKPLPNNVNQLTLDTKVWSLADVVTLVQVYLGIYEAVPNNHGVWKDSIEVRDEKAPEVAKFLAAVEKALIPLVGMTNEGIGAFGYKLPKERRQLTAEELTTRTQKMRATRAARHTMGKRQKEKIHGADSQQKPTA